MRTALISALLGAFACWFVMHEPAPAGVTVQATPAPELDRVAKQNITPAQVPVYVPKAKAKMALPQAIQNDPNKYVLTSVKLPNDTHSHTLTIVMDSTTGEVQTFDQTNPLPWFSAEKTGEARIDVGFKNEFAKIGRLTLREDLLQIKALHFGLNASLDTDGKHFIGIGASWKW